MAKKAMKGRAGEGEPLDERADRDSRNPLLKVLAILGTMKVEPRLLVLVTHGFVELLINSMVDRKCRNAGKITSNTRDFPHSTKLTILHEMRVLSDHHYRLLNWFRKLRNDSAHDPFFTLTSSRLDIIADERLRDPKHFSTLCKTILLDLWRSYNEIVGPVFLPDFYVERTRQTLRTARRVEEHLIRLTTDPEWVDEEEYDVEFPQNKMSKEIDAKIAEIQALDEAGRQQEDPKL